MPSAAAFGRVNQFLGVRFTTAAGNRGTAVGPWTTQQAQATSNGDAFPRGR